MFALRNFEFLHARGVGVGTCHELAYLGFILHTL